MNEEELEIGTVVYCKAIETCGVITQNSHGALCVSAPSYAGFVNSYTYTGAWKPVQTFSEDRVMVDVTDLDGSWVDNTYAQDEEGELKPYNLLTRAAKALYAARKPQHPEEPKTLDGAVAETVITGELWVYSQQLNKWTRVDAPEEFIRPHEMYRLLSEGFATILYYGKAD